MFPNENKSFPYIFGASVIGTYHIKNNIVCQDACYYENFQTYGIIAIADGLGSASKADVGAKIATRSAVKKAKNIISMNEGIGLKEIVIKSFEFARRSLENMAKMKKIELREFACTLIFIISYEGDVCIAHIGDGGVVGKKNNAIETLSEPEQSKYINLVTPITTNEWKESLRISLHSNIKCLAGFTDGCQMACLIKEKNKFRPYEKFFEPLFSYAYEIKDIRKGEEDIKKFLYSEKMTKDFEDDKTLVIGVLK